MKNIVGVTAMSLAALILLNCEKQAARQSAQRARTPTPPPGVNWRPQTPVAGDVVTIRYVPSYPAHISATSMTLNWGVNWWCLPPKELWSSGTVAAVTTHPLFFSSTPGAFQMNAPYTASRTVPLPPGHSVDTPMRLVGSEWITTLTTNADVSQINFGFHRDKAWHNETFTISFSRTATFDAEVRRLHFLMATSKQYKQALPALEALAADRALDRRNRVTALGDLAQTYFRLGRNADMEKTLALLPPLLPLDPMEQNNTAWQLATAGSPTSAALRVAEILAKSAVEASPGNSMHLDTYAWALSQLNKHDQAVAAQKKAIEAEGRRPDAGYYYRHATILARAGKKAEATEAYRLGTVSGVQQGDTERFRLAAAQAIGFPSGPTALIPAANLNIPDEFTTCVANLRTVQAAVEKYRKDKGQWPNWLSDLVPAYLTTQTLLCPKDKTHKALSYPDPRLPCSYTYEFSPAGRAMKTRQQQQYGDVVPVARDHCHGLYSDSKFQALNIGINGQVYWSRLQWEALFPPAGNYPGARGPYSPGMMPGYPVTPTPPMKIVRRPGPDGLIVAYDDFDKELFLDWNIQNSDSLYYWLTKKPGTLTIVTQPGDFAQSPPNYHNLFLIDCPTTEGRDLQVTTCLSFAPEANGQRAGLIVWRDPNDNLTWSLERRDGYVTLLVGVKSNGVLSDTPISFNPVRERIWLRVILRPRRCEVQLSYDGTNFLSRRDLTVGWDAPRSIGLFANNGENGNAPETDVSFEFFEATMIPQKPTGPR